MNFREQLLSELSRKNIDYIIHCIGDRQDLFDEIVGLILHDTDPVPARAAWVAEGVSEQFPEMINPHVTSLIRALPACTHPGTRRNVLKILSRTPIPEEEQGMLIDQCFGWMLDLNEPVAVKVYCMQIIANHLDTYPELSNELREVIEDQWDRNSPGFQSRGRKILRMMKGHEGFKI